MPEEYVRIAEVIDAVDLLRRWPGVTEGELAKMVREKSFPAFLQQKRLVSPDGQQVSFCTSGATPWEQRQGDETWYDWGNIVFGMEDVERLEKRHPELTWPVAGAESQAESDPRAEQEGLDWVRCDTLAKRWGWSPFDVLGILGPNKGQLRYHLPYSNYPPSNPDELSNGYVHVVDLVRWELDNAKKIKAKDDLTDDICALMEEMAERADRLYDADDEIATLTAKVTALEEEIGRLTARTGPPEHLEQRKQESTAARWEVHLQTAVALAAHVIQSGLCYTKTELENVCAQQGHPALTERAWEAFRKAIPKECINTGGRPKGKTSE